MCVSRVDERKDEPDPSITPSDRVTCETDGKEKFASVSQLLYNNNIENESKVNNNNIKNIII